MQRAEALRVLGLSAASSDAEIRRQYRSLVKAVHPDLHSNSAAATVDVAQLVEAYRVLSPQRPAGRGQASGGGNGPGARGGGGSRPGSATRPARANRPESATRSRRRTGSARESGPGAAEVVRLGRLAVGSGDAASRVRAIELLARTGRFSSAAYIRQALFDHDRDVAIAAARAMVHIPGVRIEQELLTMFSQLALHQRVAILNEAATCGRLLPRLVAYALADPAPAVARCAQEMMA